MSIHFLLERFICNSVGKRSFSGNICFFKRLKKFSVSSDSSVFITSSSVSSSTSPSSSESEIASSKSTPSSSSTSSSISSEFSSPGTNSDSSEVSSSSKLSSKFFEVFSISSSVDSDSSLIFSSSSASISAASCASASASASSASSRAICSDNSAAAFFSSEKDVSSATKSTAPSPSTSSKPINMILHLQHCFDESKFIAPHAVHSPIGSVFKPEKETPQSGQLFESIGSNEPQAPQAAICSSSSLESALSAMSISQDDVYFSYNPT